MKRAASDEQMRDDAIYARILHQEYRLQDAETAAILTEMHLRQKELELLCKYAKMAVPSTTNHTTTEEVAARRVLARLPPKASAKLLKELRCALYAMHKKGGDMRQTIIDMQDVRATFGLPPHPLIPYINALIPFEIRNATTTRKGIGTDRCVVCQCQNTRPGRLISKLPCGHEFHKSCIDKLLQERARCPMCHAEIAPGRRRR